MIRLAATWFLFQLRAERHATPVLPKANFTGFASGLPALLIWWHETIRHLQALFTRKVLVSLALLALLAASALATSYAVHKNRQLFIELQTLQAEQDFQQRRWTQLLIEESAWSAHGHIEQVATQKLGMEIPTSEQVELVK